MDDLVGPSIGILTLTMTVTTTITITLWEYEMSISLHYIYIFFSFCIYILHSKHTWKEETVDNSNCVADMVRASSSMAAQCTAVKPSRSSGNLQDGGMGQAWSKWKPTNSTIRNKPSMMSSKYIQTWDKIWINQLLKKNWKKNLNIFKPSILMLKSQLLGSRIWTRKN